MLVFVTSVGGVDALKIEEMEKMLKEAQLEKARLIESRVRLQLQRGVYRAQELNYPQSIPLDR